MGYLGAGDAQGTTISFSNTAMSHIKLTEMTSRTEYELNFHPRVILVDLG